jgi:hypothetical protein
MNASVSLTAFFSTLLLTGPLLAQGFQAQGATNTGVSTTAAPYPYQTPYPAPYAKSVDNVGADGQFIFSIERISGLFLDQQRIRYTDPEDGIEYDHTFKATSFGLLGVDSASPSALPRFALDYAVYGGLTVGATFLFSTRGLSLDGGSGQPPATPPTASPDGLTLLAGVRAGFAYAFDNTFAIWPRAGISYATSSASIDDFRNPTDGEPLGDFDYSANFASANLEILGVLSPVEHIVLMAGPYLDLGLGGGFSVEQNDVEIDKRDANLLSFGILVHAGGYY